MAETQTPAHFARAGVVGLGLIGGSLALALRRAELVVHGFDTDAETARAASRRSIMAQTTPDELLREAQIVFVALFPDETVDFITQNAARFRPGTVVVDCCGIKGRVMERVTPVAAAHDFTFIGGHPMAGKEHGGFANADVELFDDASFLLVPPEHTPPETLAALRALLAGLGFARVVATTAEEHDRMIAFTSQLPHALAAAYVMSGCCLRHAGFSAGSYRDVSRVAHLNPALWAELFLENRAAFLAETDGMLANLKALRDAAAANDRPTLENLLAQARARKDAADQTEPAAPPHAEREETDAE